MERDIVLRPEWFGCWGQLYSPREELQMHSLTSTEAKSSITTGITPITKSIQVIAAFAIIVLGLGCQPKDVRPGFWLSGDDGPSTVTNWTFTDEVDEIQIQTKTWYLLPHSTTIWGEQMGGSLYIGSYGYGEREDDMKRWEHNVARNPEATLRIDGKLYDVTVTPISNKRLIPRIHFRYKMKYDMVDTFGDDLPTWWFYRVTLRD
jgi:hypothetical protein